MTNSNRLSQLLQFMKDDPSDPFNIYAIATEYKNTNPQQAIEYFEILLENHPDYLPTYYHIAEVYIAIGNIENVDMVYKKGITLAQQQNDRTALRELQNAYNEFLFEE